MIAADRIKVIEKSLRVFVCGWLGLIPVIGLPMAAYALFESIRIRIRFGAEWNPAEAYLTCGMLLAVFSLGISILITAMIVLQLVPPFGPD